MVFFALNHERKITTNNPTAVYVYRTANTGTVSIALIPEFIRKIELFQYRKSK
jgi:hypothetical protein